MLFNLVDRKAHIGAFFEFKGDQRQPVDGPRPQLLGAINPSQLLFKRFGNEFLDIFSTRADPDDFDGNKVDIKIRKELGV